MNRGFTLIELSLVLVIFGLLIGSVLSGRSLVRSSELRSVSSQQQKLLAATQTFRDKYFALPGDMNNASQFWGLRATYGSCYSSASTDKQTCNGDGDGKVEFFVLSTPYDSYEIFRFWQHLSNAGLIEGGYTGTGTGWGLGGDSGNLPTGKIALSFWSIHLLSGYVTATPSSFAGDYGNNSFVFARTSGAGAYPTAAIFLPEELWNIDQKMDDGKPATGKLVSFGTIATCTDGVDGNAQNANYLLTSTVLACAAIFRQQF